MPTKSGLFTRLGMPPTNSRRLRSASVWDQICESRSRKRKREGVKQSVKRSRKWCELTGDLWMRQDQAGIYMFIYIDIYESCSCVLADRFHTSLCVIICKSFDFFNIHIIILFWIILGPMLSADAAVRAIILHDLRPPQPRMFKYRTQIEQVCKLLKARNYFIYSILLCCVKLDV